MLVVLHANEQESCYLMMVGPTVESGAFDCGLLLSFWRQKLKVDSQIADITCLFRKLVKLFYFKQQKHVEEVWNLNKLFNSHQCRGFN